MPPSAVANAELYQTISKNVQLIAGKNLLSKLPVKEGDYVIDVGCGTGNLVDVISEMVGPTGKVVGVDPDVTRIKAARKFCETRSNVDFHICKSTDLPSLDRLYKYAVSCYVLHWMNSESKQQTFQKLFDNMEKDGMFAAILLADKRVGNMGVLMRTVSEKLPELRQTIDDALGACVFLESLEWMQGNLEKVGFECLSIQETIVETELGTARDFLEWFIASTSGSVIEKFDIRQIYDQIDGDSIEWERSDNGLVTLALKVQHFVVKKPS